MAKTGFKNIDEYTQTFSPEIQERLQSIRKLVHELAPGVDEIISYQIPAFKLGPKFRLIYYCAFENHISLSSPWTNSMLEAFRDELKSYKVSKSAIQMPHKLPLPLELIRNILKHRLQEHQAGLI